MGRTRWTSRTVFLLAAVGAAVGLGNVWRFPYLAGKYGGGAFLIPYLIALLVVGVPMLMLEYAVGQKMQRGAIGTFKKMHSSWGSLGVVALLSCFIIVSYYAVVMAWSLVYFFASFGLEWEGDSSGFFFNNVLQISESVNTIGSINWTLLLALFAVWAMVYFCIYNGAESVGKVVWITVPLPIILLFVLLIRAVTLPGFLDGWAFYLSPDWSAILDPKVWVAAFSQIFFTLSLAFGIMVAYASYKNESDDIAKDSWITALINSGISLFAGFVVFGIIGYMAFSTGTPIDELAASGPGLAFVIFPEALSLMPMPWLFSALFFLTLLLLGIDSAFSIVEAINASIIDKNHEWQMNRVAFVVCLLAFFAGIIFTTQAGLYFLDIVDHFLTNYNLLIIGILQCILGGWIYGAERIRRYINEVSDIKVGKWWDYSIKYVTPLILVVLLIYQFINEMKAPYEGYPGWALGIGWAVVVVPFVIFALLMFTDKSRSRV